MTGSLATVYVVKEGLDLMELPEGSSLKFKILFWTKLCRRGIYASSKEDNEI